MGQGMKMGCKLCVSINISQSMPKSEQECLKPVKTYDFLFISLEKNNKLLRCPDTCASHLL